MRTVHLLKLCENGGTSDGGRQEAVGQEAKCFVLSLKVSVLSIINCACFPCNASLQPTHPVILLVPNGSDEGT